MRGAGFARAPSDFGGSEKRTEREGDKLIYSYWHLRIWKANFLYIKHIVGVEAKQGAEFLLIVMLFQLVNQLLNGQPKVNKNGIRSMTTSE